MTRKRVCCDKNHGFQIGREVNSKVRYLSTGGALGIAWASWIAKHVWCITPPNSINSHWARYSDTSAPIIGWITVRLERWFHWVRCKQFKITQYSYWSLTPICAKSVYRDLFLIPEGDKPLVILFWYSATVLVKMCRYAGISLNLKKKIKKMLLNFFIQKEKNSRKMCTGSFPPNWQPWFSSIRDWNLEQLVFLKLQGVFGCNDDIVKSAIAGIFFDGKCQ